MKMSLVNLVWLCIYICVNITLASEPKQHRGRKTKIGWLIKKGKRKFAVDLIRSNMFCFWLHLIGFDLVCFD